MSNETSNSYKRCYKQATQTINHLNIIIDNLNDDLLLTKKQLCNELNQRKIHENQIERLRTEIEDLKASSNDQPLKLKV